LNKFKIKVITTAHGSVNFESRAIIFHPMVNFIEKLAHSIYYPPLIYWEIKNLPSIPYFITVTKGIKNYLTNLGIILWKKNLKNKFYHIPNGIDTKKFYPQSPDENYISLIDKNDNEIVIMFTGGLVVRKLPYLLIKSFYLLRKIFSNIKLVFVGGGRLLNYCKLLVNNLNLNDSVIFTGYVQYNEVIKFLSLADIFVLPSIYETPGMSMLEAMAMKIPIVASNLPDINEIIVNYKNGILFKNDYNAVKNLYHQLKLLINNPELRIKIANNGYNFVRTSFDINSINEKIYKLYKYLIE